MRIRHSIGIVLLLSAYALATPTASLAPTSLSFGTQAVGIISASQDIVLSNTGGTDLTITNVGFTGTNPSDFSYTTADCTSTLVAGTSCTYSVRFTPGATGARSGNFVVTDDSGGTPGSTQTATLTGTGALVTLAPASQDFGTRNVGNTSATFTFIIGNGQATQLTISSIAIGGTNAGDFLIVVGGTCPGELGYSTPVPAFSTCTINVIFGPTAAGARSATLTATDDAGGTPGTTQSSSLTGTGIAVQLGVSGNIKMRGTTIVSGNVGNTQACGPPLYSCFNNSTVPINYSIPGPNWGATTCDWTSVATMQACGNFVGTNVTQTPTDFGNAMTRCTDVNTVSGSPQFIWTTYDAASTNAWNVDSTAFLVKVTASGNQYLFTWNPSTSQCALVTNGGSPVTFNGNAWFSHTDRTIVYWYDGTNQTQLKQSIVNYSTGGLTTSLIFDFNTSNCLLNTVNGLGALSNPAWSGATTYAKYAIVTFSGVIYSSKLNSNTNHQPDVSPTQWDVGFTQSGWVGTGNSDITDQEFARGFSTLGAQGTGGYLAAWAVGQGATSCDLWNTETNAISHNGSSVGTVSDAPWGGANGGKFDKFDMHESIVARSKTWAFTDTNTGGLIYGTSNNGAYFWQIGTTNVQVCGITAPNWKTGTAYSQGDRVLPQASNAGKFIYQIVTGSGGTSGAAPTWNQTPNTDSTSADGIPWHNVGLGTADEFNCDGHGVNLYSGFAPGKKITYHFYANPIAPQTALLPANAQSNVADQHFGSNNGNSTDSNDVFAMSAAVGTGVNLLNPGVAYPSPYYNEIYLLNPINKPDGTPNCAFDATTCPHGYGAIRRAAHTFNSGWSRVFDVQNAFTIISQDGNWAMLSTDGMGQFGNVDGTHGSCNVGAPDWIKGASGDGTTTYVPGYVVFPNPTAAANAGAYLYEIQSCSGAGGSCTTGTVPPTWVQNATVAGVGTFTDGTVTWKAHADIVTSTNTAVQNCRADIVIVKLFR